MARARGAGRGCLVARRAAARPNRRFQHVRPRQIAPLGLKRRDGAKREPSPRVFRKRGMGRPPAGGVIPGVAMVKVRGPLPDGWQRHSAVAAVRAGEGEYPDVLLDDARGRLPCRGLVRGGGRAVAGRAGSVGAGGFALVEQVVAILADGGGLEAGLGKPAAGLAATPARPATTAAIRMTSPIMMIMTYSGDLSN